MTNNPSNTEDTELTDVKQLLIDLKFLVTNHLQSYITQESTWLKELNEKILMRKIKRIIFISDNTCISDNTWKITLGEKKYAEGIALMNVFGSFNSPPIFTVIIHELIVNTFEQDNYLFFAGDTHINNDSTE